jgi:OPT family oligopeptide transporter
VSPFAWSNHSGVERPRHQDPTVLLSGIIVLLTALPLGKALEWFLPATQFRTLGYTWSLNPGPFNIKEHVVITTMGNLVLYGALTTDVVASQRLFYGHKPSFAYEVFLALTTQLLGFSLAGVLRRYLVWPSAMLWPGALVNVALFNTLHKNYQRNERKHMSRYKYFYLVTAGSFLWYWVPGYLWTGLSVFNWVCWIAPNNVPINQLFGTLGGLGMSVVTLDWAMISYAGSPLVTPVYESAPSALNDKLTMCFRSGGRKQTTFRPLYFYSGSSHLFCTVSS